VMPALMRQLRACVCTFESGWLWGFECGWVAGLGGLGVAVVDVCEDRCGSTYGWLKGEVVSVHG